MTRYLGVFAMAAPLLVAVAAEPALAQKPGGILKMYSPDSPASMSIHEEATFVAEGPIMGVFNNLVMFDQHVNQNSLGSIAPDLAAGWSWNEDGTELTLPLHQNVSWHERDRGFADSPLEGSGFELSVPPGRRRLRTGSCPSAKVI